MEFKAWADKQLQGIETLDETHYFVALLAFKFARALAQTETLPADIEDALRLAEEFCSDPDQRAQVRVQLAMNGWGKLADMIDEAVKVSRALLKVCGRE